MNRPLTIGIVGLGSIGRRHARCLHQIGVGRIVTLRSGNGRPVDADHAFVHQVATLQELLACDPAGVVIANPTSLHAAAAVPVLQAGVPVLVEKPADATLAAAEQLRPFADRVRVAYCLRFHGLYGELARQIGASRLGRVYKASFRRGYYLPLWHPESDYRTEYTARKDLGGGAIRTLSHELDIAIHLFGRFSSVRGCVDRVSNLELDVDDCAVFTARTRSGIRLAFDIDLLSPTNENRVEVLGERGAIRFSFHDRRMLFSTPSGPEASLAQLPDDETEKMYVRQAEDFLRFIRGGPSQIATLDDALHCLEVIETLEAGRQLIGDARVCE